MAAWRGTNAYEAARPAPAVAAREAAALSASAEGRMLSAKQLTRVRRREAQRRREAAEDAEREAMLAALEQRRERQRRERGFIYAQREQKPAERRELAHRAPATMPCARKAGDGGYAKGAQVPTPASALPLNELNAPPQSRQRRAKLQPQSAQQQQQQTQQQEQQQQDQWRQRQQREQRQQQEGQSALKQLISQRRQQMREERAQQVDLAREEEERRRAQAPQPAFAALKAEAADGLANLLNEALPASAMPVEPALPPKSEAPATIEFQAPLRRPRLGERMTAPAPASAPAHAAPTQPVLCASPKQSGEAAERAEERRRERIAAAEAKAAAARAEAEHEAELARAQHEKAREAAERARQVAARRQALEAATAAAEQSGVHQTELVAAVAAVDPGPVVVKPYTAPSQHIAFTSAASAPRSLGTKPLQNTDEELGERLALARVAAEGDGGAKAVASRLGGESHEGGGEDGHRERGQQQDIGDDDSCESEQNVLDSWRGGGARGLEVAIAMAEAGGCSGDAADEGFSFSAPTPEDSERPRQPRVRTPDHPDAISIRSEAPPRPSLKRAAGNGTRAVQTTHALPPPPAAEKKQSTSMASDVALLGVEEPARAASKADASSAYGASATHARHSSAVAVTAAALDKPMSASPEKNPPLDQTPSPAGSGSGSEDASPARRLAMTCDAATGVGSSLQPTPREEPSLHSIAVGSSIAMRNHSVADGCSTAAFADPKKQSVAVGKSTSAFDVPAHSVAVGCSAAFAEPMSPPTPELRERGTGVQMSLEQPFEDAGPSREELARMVAQQSDEIAELRRLISAQQQLQQQMMPETQGAHGMRASVHAPTLMTAPTPAPTPVPTSGLPAPRQQSKPRPPPLDVGMGSTAVAVGVENLCPGASSLYDDEFAEPPLAEMVALPQAPSEGAPSHAPSESSFVALGEEAPRGAEAKLVRDGSYAANAALERARARRAADAKRQPKQQPQRSGAQITADSTDARPPMQRTTGGDHHNTAPVELAESLAALAHEQTRHPAQWAQASKTMGGSSTRPKGQQRAATRVRVHPVAANANHRRRQSAGVRGREAEAHAGRDKRDGDHTGLSMEESDLLASLARLDGRLAHLDSSEKAERKVRVELLGPPSPGQGAVRLAHGATTGAAVFAPGISGFPQRYADSDTATRKPGPAPVPQARRGAAQQARPGRRNGRGSGRITQTGALRANPQLRPWE